MFQIVVIGQCWKTQENFTYDSQALLDLESDAALSPLYLKSPASTGV